jgi:hypothetical protein
VTKELSALIDDPELSRRISRLWSDHEKVYSEIKELVAAQLTLSRFDELDHADRKAVLVRTEFMIEAWAASGRHLEGSNEGSTPMKAALNRICRLGDEIAAIETRFRHAADRV